MKRFFWGTILVLVIAALAYVVPARVYAPIADTFLQERPVRVLFVGDIMLDRNVARTIAAEGPEALFVNLTDFLADADVRVGNLEGTITHNASVAQKNNKILRFTFSPADARAVLEPLHFDALSLANNHALDFGEFGYEDTELELSKIGVQSFGKPYNDKYKLSTKLQVRAGKTICLVGYHSLFVATTTNVLAEIQTLRPDCWQVVVFAHWGEEYVIHSNTSQQAAAHAFIDAGADVVIGAHPHVVQESEIYKGKAIFYSLGNFMFDQNFSWETTHGLAVRVDFYEDKTRFVLTPTTIKEQHAALAEGEEKDAILGRFGGVAEFSLP